MKYQCIQGVTKHYFLSIRGLDTQEISKPPVLKPRCLFSCFIMLFPWLSDKEAFYCVQDYRYALPEHLYFGGVPRDLELDINGKENINLI